MCYGQLRWRVLRMRPRIQRLLLHGRRSQISFDNSVHCRHRERSKSNGVSDRCRPGRTCMKCVSVFEAAPQRSYGRPREDCRPAARLPCCRRCSTSYCLLSKGCSAGRGSLIVSVRHSGGALAAEPDLGGISAAVVP